VGVVIYKDLHGFIKQVERLGAHLRRGPAFRTRRHWPDLAFTNKTLWQNGLERSLLKAGSCPAFIKPGHGRRAIAGRSCSVI